MMRNIVWPEDEPERAVECFGFWSKWWRMVGPMGLAASLRGKRMTCAWSEAFEQHTPVDIATFIEATMRQARDRR